MKDTTLYLLPFDFYASTIAYLVKYILENKEFIIISGC